jgi:hypothetical protein
MKKIWLSALLGSTLIGCSPTAEPPDISEFMISELRKTDELKVSYLSSHWDTVLGVYTFFGNDVRDVKGRTLTLSSGEMSELDEYLQSVASSKPKMGRCSNTTYIKLKLVRPGKRDRSIELTDTYCHWSEGEASFEGISNYFAENLETPDWRSTEPASLLGD